MTEKIKPILVKISKLNLKPGDYLVLRFPPDKYSHADVIDVAESIGQAFPDLRVLLFYDDIQIDIVHQEEK